MRWHSPKILPFWLKKSHDLERAVVLYDSEAAGARTQALVITANSAENCFEPQGRGLLDLSVTLVTIVVPRQNSRLQTSWS